MFYHNGIPLRDDELEQIESIEDETGEIRNRFIIKGLENSPIFVEEKTLKLKNRYDYPITEREYREALYYSFEREQERKMKEEREFYFKESNRWRNNKCYGDITLKNPCREFDFSPLLDDYSIEQEIKERQQIEYTVLVHNVRANVRQLSIDDLQELINYIKALIESKNPIGR